jgi:NADPH-dependent 2,4-dienoyl-CoA reductase/sulfur reductase-like enzyme
LKEIQGDDHVKKVQLSNGKIIDADLVILGTGVIPNTKGFSDGVRITENGGIETDVYLRTSKPDVWAAGDVASFPYWATGENVRIEHHNEAIY